MEPLEIIEGWAFQISFAGEGFGNAKNYLKCTINIIDNLIVTKNNRSNLIITT
jgi:hypothetical protein